MALDANEVIQCRGVFKSFGGVQANKNISLNVFEGHITGLIGPNGSVRANSAIFSLEGPFSAIFSA